MRLIRVLPPASPPVTLAQAKAQLRVDGDDADLRIAGLIDAAVDHLDGYRGVLGRCMVTQTWRAEIDSLGERLSLPFPDTTIVSAEFTDALAGTLAWVWHEALAAPALIPEDGWGRPVAVTFTAGFGAPAEVPMALKQAVLIMVEHLHDDPLAPLPPSFGELIAPYRWRRV